MSTEGVEIMRRLGEGSLTQAPSAFVEKSRSKISAACEELLDMGARVRPLYVGKQRVGWVRGVHMAERKILQRWIFDQNEMVEQIIQLGSTLTIHEIKEMGAAELRSIARLITKMTESDLRLYPFISAFVTTGLSEQMWYSRGTEITSFHDRHVTLPDGSRMKLLCPPDQARLWATLCNYREKAKRRVDETMNALLIVRPWVGKGADAMSTELRNTLKGLQPDVLDPWMEVIQKTKERRQDDGWAHSDEDSLEGIQRELAGMLNNDRHQRVIAAFEKQEAEKAVRKQQEIEDRIASRGGAGFYDQTSEILTESEVRENLRKLKIGQPVGPKPKANYEVQPNERIGLAKYR